LPAPLTANQRIPRMSKGMDKKKDVKKKPSKTVKEKKEAKTAKKAKQDRL
jgi:hypothetical protein